MRNKHLSYTWVLLLKLHKPTFSHWERSFQHLCPCFLSSLLSCTKQSISVLRSSKLVILCIEALTWQTLQKCSKTWKSSALQITFHFMRKKHLSCTWVLLLKLHKPTSLTEREAFQHLWPCFLFFFALNRALVFLEALNWFCALKL